METDVRLSIAVLYTHALLGEGLARLLGAEPGADVTYVTCAEPERVESTLASEPDVVVVERSPAFDAFAILQRLPEALVIDIGIGPGPTWVYRRQEIPGDPEAILRLIRRLRGGHPVVALEGPPPSVEPAPPASFEPAPPAPAASVEGVSAKPAAVRPAIAVASRQG